jgi:hypothetical protein
LNFHVSNLKLESNWIGSLDYSFANLPNSVILDPNEFYTLKLLCQFPTDTKWSLVYRASNDGYTASAFHSKCDDLFDTFSLIKTTDGSIFGGFTKRNWKLIDKCELEDPESFVISFKNSYNRKFKEIVGLNGGIFCNPSYGPGFINKDRWHFIIPDNFNSEKCEFPVLDLELFKIDY